MDGKKLIYSALASFSVMFILSGIWYLVVMMDYYEEAMAGIYNASAILEEPDLVFIAIGYFIYALIMAYVFPIGYKGGSAVTEGMKFGASKSGLEPKNPIQALSP